MASAEGPGAIDVVLCYISLGPELEERYTFFENSILCGVASSGVRGSMSETENCIKINFKGDICGIVILGDHYITDGNFIIKGRVASSKVGVDLNANLDNQDFSYQTDILGQVTGKAEFKTNCSDCVFTLSKKSHRYIQDAR